MRVELVSPTWTEETSKARAETAKVFKIPPLGLLNVAAITPKGVEVSLTDENVEPVNFDCSPDLVGITVMTASAPRAYQIADRFRELGVPVVLGGPHVTFLPEEASLHADAAVLGEAEGCWQKLVEDFQKKGKRGLKKFYKNDEKPDMSTVPLPRVDLLKGGKHIVTNVLHITRGCPYNCAFCSVTRLFGQKLRFRRVEQVVEFVEKNRGNSLNGRFFGFTDDNIMANHSYARKLFQALVPYRIIWASQTSVNAAYDTQLLRLAKRSGCIAVFLGLESLSAASLAEMNKPQNKVEFYQEAIKRFHYYGIFVEGAFIFGFDRDERDVFARTVEFANRVKLDAVQYTIATPLPGTAFYETLEKQGRIIDRDWANYDCLHAVFRPRNMTPEELEEGLVWAYENTYSLPSVFKRVTGIFTGGRAKYLFPLLIFNLGYRNTIPKRRTSQQAVSY